MGLFKAFEYSVMFLSDFLKDEAEIELSRDLKTVYKLMSFYRRVLKAFNMPQLLREFQVIHSSRTVQYNKPLIVFSKLCSLVYALSDAVSLFYGQPFLALRGDSKQLGRLRKPRWIYYLKLAAAVSAGVFYLSQLRASYHREMSLKEEFCERFGPGEVLEILQDLSRERKIIYIKLTKVLAECFMIFQFTRISERLFFLKVDSSVVALVGILVSILELALEQPLLKKLFLENPILIC